jgi:hypothetical protein
LAFVSDFPGRTLSLEDVELFEFLSLVFATRLIFLILEHGLDLITLLDEPLRTAEVILALIILVLLAIVLFGNLLRLLAHSIHGQDSLTLLDDWAERALQSKRVVRKLVIPQRLLPRRLIFLGNKRQVVFLVELWRREGDARVTDVVWVLNFLVGRCH